MSIVRYIRDGFIDFIEYKTPKIVSIRNKKVGVLNRLIQLGIISYIIGYMIIYQKGYQDYSTIESSVTTKVKGVLSTESLSDELFANGTDPQLYQRVWDTPDYVVPASENGAFFVMTNVIITPNQSLSSCPEASDVKGIECKENKDCVEGQIFPGGNGLQTGNCVDSVYPLGMKVCEIRSWCPLEKDILPLINETALLGDSKNFTVLIKNTINFKTFKVQRRNILDTNDKDYLRTCRFHPVTDVQCPIFGLNEIVESAGQNYDEIAMKGAVIGIIIDWTCDLDRDVEKCVPVYSFTRLDNSKSKVSPGWNFRFANYFGNSERTLFKGYGIRFAVIVTGTGGKFNLVTLTIKIGSGLGLLAVTTIICDLIVLYLLNGKAYYKDKKYLQVEEIEDVEETSTARKRIQMNPADNNQTNLFGQD